MNRQSHQTLGALKNAVVGETYAGFATGSRVQTVDGYPGRVTAVLDGPYPQTETYEVQLDNGLGGGEYTARQLRPLTERTAAVEEPMSAEAGELHLASQDYPELGTILYDRPPNERVKVYAGLQATTRSRGGAVLTATHIPAAERTESVSHMLSHYKPTDFDTWDEVRNNIDWNHPKIRAFMDDIRQNGVRRPIPVDYECDPPQVMNGHTRLLAAERVGVASVPTRQHEGFMDPDDPDHLGRGPDHPEHWTHTWGGKEAVQIEQISPPSACSWCGYDQFTNPTNTGRGLRMECAQCGGTMTSWGGQWQPDMTSSPENHPRRDADSRAVINDPAVVHASLRTEAGQRETWNILMGRAPDDDGDAPLREPMKVKHQVENIDDRAYTVHDVDRANAEGGLDTAWELEGHKREPAKATFRLQHVPIDSLRVINIGRDGLPYKRQPYGTRHMEAQDSEDETWEHERLDSIRQGYQQNPDQVPPIVVVRHGPHHVIVDGSHRVGVATENGATHIPAFVTDHEPSAHESALTADSWDHWLAPETIASRRNFGEQVMARYDLLDLGDPAAAAVAVDPRSDPVGYLRGITAQANDDPDLGFHMLATWAEVREKAKRIKDSGGVRILAASAQGVVGEVQGEHALYESAFNYVPGTRKLADWNCGCKWGAYAWGRSPAYRRFEGRKCSHVTALQFEAQSRGMFGQDVTEDRQRLPGQYQRSPVTVQYERPTERADGGNLNRRSVPPGNMRRTFSSSIHPDSEYAQQGHDETSAFETAINRVQQRHIAEGNHLWHEQRQDSDHHGNAYSLGVAPENALQNFHDANGGREPSPEEHVEYMRGAYGDGQHPYWDEVEDEVRRMKSAPQQHEGALDLAPVHVFAREMAQAGDTSGAVFRMLANHGVPEENALRIIRWAVTGDDDGGSTQPGQDIPGITTRDTTEFKKRPHHHDHHTNDTRRHAPDFGRGIGWYAPGLMWCDQCNGSGCGHCGGSGEVMQGVSPTGGPGMGDLSTTTSPIADEDADAGEDISGGISTAGALEPEVPVQDGVWYHGSRHTLQPGQILTGGHAKSNQGYGQPGEHVYYTGRHDVASAFAEAGNGPDHRPDAQPKVYLVEPIEGHEPDPDEPEEMHSYRARSVRVLNRVRYDHDGPRKIFGSRQAAPVAATLQQHQWLLQHYADASTSLMGGNPAPANNPLTPHSDSCNPGSTGWGTSADPHAWTHPIINNSYEIAAEASTHIGVTPEEHARYWDSEPESPPCREPWCVTNEAPHSEAEHIDPPHLDPGHPDYHSAERSIEEAFGHHSDADWLMGQQGTGPTKYSVLSTTGVGVVGQVFLLDYTHAGLALKAADTGRVLMIQRSFKDDKDPAKGTWEFPGGGKEDGDQTSLHTGIREWQEEVGQPFPEGGHVSHTWRAGTYHGHVVVIPSESQVDFSGGRATTNPDDPGGDDHEQSAWWDPQHAKKNPALREELKRDNPFGAIEKAAAISTPCQTPEVIYDTTIGDRTIGVTAEMPMDVDLDAQQANTLDRNLHNMMEMALAPLFPPAYEPPHKAAHLLTFDEVYEVARAEERRTGKSSEQLLREHVAWREQRLADWSRNGSVTTVDSVRGNPESGTYKAATSVPTTTHSSTRDGIESVSSLSVVAGDYFYALENRRVLHDDAAQRGHAMEWKRQSVEGKPTNSFHGECKHCGATMSVGPTWSSSDHPRRDARDMHCSGPGTKWQSDMERELSGQRFQNAVSDFGQAVKDNHDREWLHGQGIEASLHDQPELALSTIAESHDDLRSLIPGYPAEKAREWMGDVDFHYVDHYPLAKFHEDWSEPTAPEDHEDDDNGRHEPGYFHDLYRAVGEGRTPPLVVHEHDWHDGKEPSAEIVDGTHRMQYGLMQGRTHMPAWVHTQHHATDNHFAILRGEPEAALPSTDGDVENDLTPDEAEGTGWQPGDPAPGQYLAAQPDIPWGYPGGPSDPPPLQMSGSLDDVPLDQLVAAFQSTAMGRQLASDAATAPPTDMAAAGGRQRGDIPPPPEIQAENAQLAAIAQAVLAGEIEVGDNGITKSSMRNFDLAEQQELITEGANEGTLARNFDGLQIEGTHYALLDDPDMTGWM